MEKDLPTAQEIHRSVQIFKALGDKTRYRILYFLFKRSFSVTELADVLGISQSALSHQLSLLRQAGLVSGERNGQFIIYKLADEHIMIILKQVKAHIHENRY